MAQEIVRNVINISENQEGNIDMAGLKSIKIKDCP